MGENWEKYIIFIKTFGITASKGSVKQDIVVAELARLFKKRQPRLATT